MVFSVRREVPDGSAALPVLTLRSLPARSLSSSMQSLSSGSSPGSLTSSRGSLAASSLDSSTSASFTDLYYDPFEQLDSELQYKVEFLLLEGATGFRPSGCITTIHEDEVAKTQKAEGGSRLQALRSLSGTPKSMTSLSPRSSLSSPSPKENLRFILRRLKCRVSEIPVEGRIIEPITEKLNKHVHVGC